MNGPREDHTKGAQKEKAQYGYHKYVESQVGQRQSSDLGLCTFTEGGVGLIFGGWTTIKILQAKQCGPPHPPSQKNPASSIFLTFLQFNCSKQYPNMIHISSAYI